MKINHVKIKVAERKRSALQIPRMHLVSTHSRSGTVRVFWALIPYLCTVRALFRIIQVPSGHRLVTFLTPSEAFPTPSGHHLGPYEDFDDLRISFKFSQKNKRNYSLISQLHLLILNSLLIKYIRYIQVVSGIYKFLKSYIHLYLK